MLTRAVHHDPRTQYRSNRKEYRTNRFKCLQRLSRKKNRAKTFGAVLYVVAFQSGPPRPSDAISIEPNGIPNRPNRKTHIRVSVVRYFFGLQASYRAETWTPDRSRAPRLGEKIEKSVKIPNRPNRSTRSTDRATDRTDRRPPW